MNNNLFVFLVDDDYAVREGLSMMIENAGLLCKTFESAEQFLADYNPKDFGCIVLDVNMQGMTGHDMQNELIQRNINLPIIFLTAYGSIPLTVRAMKAGAIDFLTKPVPSKLLLERVQTALQLAEQSIEQHLEKQQINSRLKELTARESEVLPLVVAGLTNKEIGKKLGISYRTIEIHRARIFQKTGVTTVLELGRLCEFIKPQISV